MLLKLKDGTTLTVPMTSGRYHLMVEHCEVKARDRSRARAIRDARARKASSQGKSNVGNPRDKGKTREKCGAFDPTSKSHRKAMRKQKRKSR